MSIPKGLSLLPYVDTQVSVLETTPDFKGRHPCTLCDPDRPALWLATRGSVMALWAQDWHRAVHNIKAELSASAV